MSCLSRLAVFALVGLSLIANTLAGSPVLRGLAISSLGSGACSDLAALNNVEWYYDYTLSPLPELSNCDTQWAQSGARTGGVEFVPIVWGANSITNIAKSIPSNTKYLMSFNEPNFASQSNLTPQQAATAWMDVVSQLQTAGLLNQIKLGAPSASPGGGTDPSVWLTSFFQLCTGCVFHFQSFHVYDCNYPHFDAGAVSYWINQAHNVSGLPIWLTEFSCPSNSASYTVSVLNETTWLKRVLDLLDSSSFIERYAWFTARATNVGTVPSLLNASPGSITDVGTVYNSYGNPTSTLTPYNSPSTTPSPTSTTNNPSSSSNPTGGPTSVTSSPSPTATGTGTIPVITTINPKTVNSYGLRKMEAPFNFLFLLGLSFGALVLVIDRLC